MKVEKITAFKSNDDSIWEKEGEAIHQNIEDIIRDDLAHDCENSNGQITQEILLWFRDYPKDIKYIQANIKNLLPHHFGEEE
jgi:predicted Holliday junction resolvase-like endonuclease